MNTFVLTIEYFVTITIELTVLFLGISAAVALALMYVPQEKISAWMANRGVFGNFMAATVGALTPFCACSTIPVTLGMLNAGVPFGHVMSFVIASPLLNPIIIGMVATLMGLEACLIYFSATFFGSILFGVLLDKARGARYVRNVRAKQSCCGSNENAIPMSFFGKIKVASKSAWGDFRSVLVFLLVGVGIGAVIYGYIPEEFVARIAGPENPLAVPVAAIIGIPLYIRAETAIPIGLALSEKGMSMGAVIALIIGGAGMAIPEMTMLASIFRKRLVAAIVAVVFATAVIGGYVFNIFF